MRREVKATLQTAVLGLANLCSSPRIFEFRYSDEDGTSLCGLNGKSSEQLSVLP